MTVEGWDSEKKRRGAFGRGWLLWKEEAWKIFTWCPHVIHLTSYLPTPLEPKPLHTRKKVFWSEYADCTVNLTLHEILLNIDSKKEYRFILVETCTPPRHKHIL